MVNQSGQDFITCPMCKESHMGGEYAGSSLVKQFLNLHHSRQAPNLKCPLCCENNIEWKCVDCKINMCGFCQKSHSRTPMSKDHKFELYMGEKEFALDELHFCEAHKNQAQEVYCTECNQLICMVCKDINHIGHTCENVEERNRELAAQVQKMLQSLEHDYEKCKK